MNIRIGNTVVGKNDADRLQSLLGAAYAGKQRPACLCKTAGVEMYIAKINGNFCMKRMPGSGVKHAASCDSYEPPIELSGLGEVSGRAIQEDAISGVTNVKLDFSLSCLGKRGPNATQSDAEKPSVKSDGSKLTPRGLLHYLWNEAGFTRWSPAMTGKRSWYVIRKYLLEAASGKFAKGSSLASRLYVPETFNSEKKQEIDERRRKQFHEVFSADKGSSKSMMILVGEIKEIETTAIGDKLIIKHLPSTPFIVPRDLSKRMRKNFGSEIENNAIVEGSHLLALATFERTDAGALWINEITLMTVNSCWIPFETLDESQLLMAVEKRYFVKGLRFNMPREKAMASLVLSDTGIQPTACYITQLRDEGTQLDEISALISQSELASWVWDSVEHAMPALPLAGSDHVGHG